MFTSLLVLKHRFLTVEASSTERSCSYREETCKKMLLGSPGFIQKKSSLFARMVRKGRERERKDDSTREIHLYRKAGKKKRFYADFAWEWITRGDSIWEKTWFYAAQSMRQFLSAWFGRKVCIETRENLSTTDMYMLTIFKYDYMNDMWSGWNTER